MSILGVHTLLYSSEPEALRTTLRDVFGLKSVDAGGGWLIFALPPAELGVHPTEGEKADAVGRHQISFMCDDIAATMSDLKKRGVHFDSEPHSEGFGIVVMMTLPGGVKVMLYQPRHATAISLTKTMSS